MDEPTNHLDIWSCEAAERSIREFEGTVLVVGHDRYFLNQVADRLIVLGNGKTRSSKATTKPINGSRSKRPRRLRQRRRNASLPLPSAPSTDGPRATVPTRRKRKYPYRKPWRTR